MGSETECKSGEQVLPRSKNNSKFSDLRTRKNDIALINSTRRQLPGYEYVDCYFLDDRFILSFFVRSFEDLEEDGEEEVGGWEEDGGEGREETDGYSHEAEGDC